MSQLGLWESVAGDLGQEPGRSLLTTSYEEWWGHQSLWTSLFVSEKWALISAPHVSIVLWVGDIK